MVLSHWIQKVRAAAAGQRTKGTLCEHPHAFTCTYVVLVAVEEFVDLLFDPRLYSHSLANFDHLVLAVLHGQDTRTFQLLRTFLITKTGVLLGLSHFLEEWAEKCI